MIAGPTMTQLDWKNFAEKPSGSGALYGCIANIASLISKGDGIEVSCALVSSEMQGVRAELTMSVAEEPEEVKISLK